MPLKLNANYLGSILNLLLEIQGDGQDENTARLVVHKTEDYSWEKLMSC